MKRYVLVTLLAIFGCTPNLWADDTEIYGTVNNPSLEPNVMVLFDTSGSMATEDVPGDPYVPSQAYDLRQLQLFPKCGLLPALQFKHPQLLLGSQFTSDINNLACAAIKEHLFARGTRRATSAPPGYTCGGVKTTVLRTRQLPELRRLRAGETRSRISVAQAGADGPHPRHRRVRFGMIVFNWDQGGRLVAACGTDKSTLLSSRGRGPAERLDAAGRNPVRDRSLLCGQAELVQLRTPPTPLPCSSAARKTTSSS